MHHSFYDDGKKTMPKNNGDIFSLLSHSDSDTALILSVMLLLKKEGNHDILLPLLLYILM